MHNIFKKNDRNLWGPFLWGPLGSCPLCPLLNPALYVYTSSNSWEFHLVKNVSLVFIETSSKNLQEIKITVETQYNEILGTETICSLYQIYCYMISSQ